MAEFRLIRKDGFPAGRDDPREDRSPARFRELYEGTFDPPNGARTFSDYDAAAASRLCENRPHVIIREDPMFGRRGYAREILRDAAAPGGYLVLVIAFTTKRDSSGRLVEPVKPRASDRRFWSPGKVEFVCKR